MWYGYLSKGRFESLNLTMEGKWSLLILSAFSTLFFKTPLHRVGWPATNRDLQLNSKTTTTTRTRFCQYCANVNQRHFDGKRLKSSFYYGFRDLKFKTRTTKRTRFCQYLLVRTREPASFWRTDLDKRGSRRHFFLSFSENIAVAKTS